MRRRPTKRMMEILHALQQDTYMRQCGQLNDGQFDIGGYHAQTLAALYRHHLIRFIVIAEPTAEGLDILKHDGKPKPKTAKIIKFEPPRE